jgi:hypothetical protein
VEDDCVLWWKATNRDGYGVFSYRRNGYVINRIAHRKIYEECYGSIPEGLVVRHKCDNPPCVNPNHLELGTTRQNNEDRVRRGRDGNSNKTHCKWGHAYDQDNTGRSKLGRYCRRCNADRMNEWYRNNKCAS